MSETIAVTVNIDKGYIPELLEHIRRELRDGLRLMLIAVPEAVRQFARGNVVTAFGLLRAATNFTVKKGYTKEMVLDMAFGDLPTDFRISDIDPD